MRRPAFSPPCARKQKKALLTGAVITVDKEENKKRDLKKKNVSVYQSVGRGDGLSVHHTCDIKCVVDGLSCEQKTVSDIIWKTFELFIFVRFISRRLAVISRYHFRHIFSLNFWPSISTVEPRYNEGPRDWQNMFAIPRFRYIEVLFHIFYYYWGKENRSLFRGLRYMEVPL